MQQQGFQSRLGCETVSFNLLETIHHNIEQGNKVYGGFIDLHKAFESVNHDCLFFKLKQLGINGKILDVIKSCYTNLTSFVLINGCKSRNFKIQKGVDKEDVFQL